MHRELVASCAREALESLGNSPASVGAWLLALLQSIKLSQALSVSLPRFGLDSASLPLFNLYQHIYSHAQRNDHILPKIHDRLVQQSVPFSRLQISPQFTSEVASSLPSIVRVIVLQHSNGEAMMACRCKFSDYLLYTLTSLRLSLSLSLSVYLCLYRTFSLISCPPLLSFSFPSLLCISLKRPKTIVWMCPFSSGMQLRSNRCRWSIISNDYRAISNMCSLPDERRDQWRGWKVGSYPNKIEKMAIAYLFSFLLWSVPQQSCSSGSAPQILLCQAMATTKPCIYKRG